MFNQKSIAVLPLRNISQNEDNEYFVDGLTAEVMFALSQIDGLKVSSSTSSFAYKNKAVDVRLIGNELGVSTVLEGSIRFLKNRIRLSVHLVRTDTGYTVWTESFDREISDIFDLQNELALNIAEKIRENFGHLDIQEKLMIVKSSNMEAYDAYLHGRHHLLKWNKDNFHQAIICFEESIRLDPDYPMSHISLSLCYTYLESWANSEGHFFKEKAQYHLDKVKNEYQALAEFHFANASLQFWGYWNFGAAFKSLIHCLAINESYAEAYEALAEIYTALNRVETARFYIQKAIDLNPHSPNHYFGLGNTFYREGKYEEAIRCFDKSLEIDNEWELARQFKAACLILQKDKVKLHDFVTTSGVENAENFIELFDAVHLKPEKTHDSVIWGYMCWDCYFRIYENRVDDAFDVLEDAAQKHCGQYVWIATDPFLKPIKEDVRYKNILKKYYDYPDIQQFEQVESNKKTKEGLGLEESEIEDIVTRIESLFENKKVYLDPSLSLRDLADELDISSNKLSWIINNRLGKNYNEFVNSYRLTAFINNATKSEFKNMTILAIAYESGFSSKSVFNDYFKKEMGMTPSKWIKLKIKS